MTSSQKEHVMDEVLQHIMTSVLGKSSNDVLCLAVDQNFGCIDDIMSCNLELFKELTVMPPNASTPVKMVDQPRCKGDAHLLQALKLFASQGNISCATDWLAITKEQFSSFQCKVHEPSPFPVVTASSPTDHGHAGLSTHPSIVESF